MMKLAKPVRIQNETGTACGHINALPVDGCVYIISAYGNGESEYQIKQVYVDDLDTFSQNVVYQLIKRAKAKHGND